MSRDKTYETTRQEQLAVEQQALAAYGVGLNGAGGYSGPEPLSPAQERALRLAHVTARRWLEAHAHGPLAVAEFEGTREAALVRRLLKNFIDDLLVGVGPNLVTEILDTYFHEMGMGRRGSPRSAMTDTFGGSR